MTVNVPTCSRNQQAAHFGFSALAACCNSSLPTLTVPFDLSVAGPDAALHQSADRHHAAARQIQQLDETRYEALERATQLRARTPGGLRAKAIILVGEAELCGCWSLDDHERLGLSLCRDIMTGDWS